VLGQGQDSRRLLVCGGGALNSQLMRRLRQPCPASASNPPPRPACRRCRWRPPPLPGWRARRCGACPATWPA
jgi:hypothetical protein